MTIPDRPNRRFPRFPTILLAAVVLVVVVGLLSVWWPYHREQVAIAEIERVGGGVHSAPGGPDWLRNIVGDGPMKVFDRVTEVNLVETTVDDGILEHVGRFTWLQTLSLDRSNVADAELVHLRGLKNLQTLSLWDTRITDRGLEPLAGLTRLETVSLWGTQVTDAGLVHLDGLTHLERLTLTNTKVTKVGADKLSMKLRRCRVWFDQHAE